MDFFDPDLKSSFVDPFYPYALSDSNRNIILGHPILAGIVRTVTAASDYALFANTYETAESLIHNITFCDSYGLFYIQLLVDTSKNTYEAHVIKNSLSPTKRELAKIAAGKCGSYKGLVAALMPNNKTFKRKTVIAEHLAGGIAKRIVESRKTFIGEIAKYTDAAIRISWTTQDAFKSGVLAGKSDLNIHDGFDNCVIDIYTALTTGVVSSVVRDWITKILPRTKACEDVWQSWHTAFSADRYLIISLPHDKGVIVAGVDTVLTPKTIPTYNEKCIHFNLTLSEPPRYYRTIDALDARIHDDVQASLAIAKTMAGQNVAEFYQHGSKPISDPNNLIMRRDMGFANCGMLTYSPSAGNDTYYVMSVRKIGG